MYLLQEKINTPWPITFFVQVTADGNSRNV